MFLDFIDSDEWHLPIRSFIEYYCLVFSSRDHKEHEAEKRKVYDDYKSTVTIMLDDFLNEILGMTREGLSKLLQKFSGELDFDDLAYMLAVEDYDIFHDFMTACNRKMD